MKLLSFLARFLLVFLVAEGLCSTISAAAGMLKVIRESPRLYTRYDPLLGWTSTPGLSLPDQYGPGVGFHTNSRGFRGVRDFADSAPGKVRIVCSGDSFTLGVGVADGETWCARLESLAPGLEAVNMGQAGYGIDQAYLWFKRDGVKLGERLHVFAFVSADIDRMLVDTFVGFGKPYLDLRGGALVVNNVPVPRGPYLFPWLTLLAPRLNDLQTVSAARRLVGAGAQRTAGRGPSASPLDLLFAVAEDLRRLDQAGGSRLVMVYLPTIADCTPNPLFDRWRADLRSEFERRGFDYLDLVSDFRARPSDPLFVPATVMGRHYSAEGNRLVAQVLHERLSPWLPGATEPLGSNPGASGNLTPPRGTR